MGENGGHWTIQMAPQSSKQDLFVPRCFPSDWRIIATIDPRLESKIRFGFRERARLSRGISSLRPYTGRIFALLTDSTSACGRDFIEASTRFYNLITFLLDD